MEPEVTTGFELMLSVVGDIWDGIGGVIDVIESNALLLIPIAGMFAALIIGLCMKLMGIRRRRGR